MLDHNSTMEFDQKLVELICRDDFELIFTEHSWWHKRYILESCLISKFPFWVSSCYSITVLERVFSFECSWVCGAMDEHIDMLWWRRWMDLQKLEHLKDALLNWLKCFLIILFSVSCFRIILKVFLDAKQTDNEPRSQEQCAFLPQDLSLFELDHQRFLFYWSKIIKDSFNITRFCHWSSFGFYCGKNNNALPICSARYCGL